MADDHSDSIRAYYDSIATRYNQWIAPVIRPLVADLLDRSPLFPRGARTLDIGTGTGIGVALLTERGAHAIGIDMSAGMLKQSAPNLALVQADLAHPPFAQPSFDGVFASFGLNLSAPRTVFSTIGTLLRPGGWLIGLEWAAQDPLSATFDRAVAELDLIENDPREVLFDQAERWSNTMQDVDDYRARLAAAGFVKIEVKEEVAFIPYQLPLFTFVAYRLAWLMAPTPELVRLIAAQTASFANVNTIVLWKPSMFKFAAQKPLS